MREAVGNRVVADLDVACPAGDPIGEVLGGSGVYCRIEQSLVVSALQPKSLGRFCCSVDGHRRCPTLRKDTQRIEAGETTPLIHQIHPAVIERMRREEQLAEQRERAAFEGRKLDMPTGGTLHLTCEACGEMERIRVPHLDRVSDEQAEQMFTGRGWVLRPAQLCPGCQKAGVR